MITIPEVVAKIIKKSLYLEEALALGLINLSALARFIKPDVEREAMKEVKDGAVIVALNRLSRKTVKRARRLKSVFRNAPDLTVRSNLMEVTYANAERLIVRQKKLLDQLGGKPGYFLTVTQGINETTIIASRELKEKILAIFKGERIIARIENLSSITVLLPRGTALVPGVYSYILKSLAWEGINIVEVVSTLDEFTLILEDKNIDQAFSLIKKLF
jgi:hypothetical protein